MRDRLSFGGSLDALTGHVFGALDGLALRARQVGAVLRLHAQPVHRGGAHDRISVGMNTGFRIRDAECSSYFYDLNIREWFHFFYLRIAR